MTKRTEAKKKMVYTPECHIPIGEACKTASGEYALRIKKPKSNEIEVVSLGQLVTKVAQAAEASKHKAGSPDEELATAP